MPNPNEKASVSPNFKIFPGLGNIKPGLANELALSESAAGSIYIYFSNFLKDGFRNFLFFPNFDLSQITSHLHQTILQKQDIVIPGILRYEDWHDRRGRLLHNFLDKNGISPEEFSELTLDDRILTDLHAQVDKLPDDFQPLASWREKLAKTGILDLVIQINNLSKENPEKGAWVRTAFNTIRKATESPKDFTLDKNDLDALMLITFMPYHLRTLTRRLITGNVVMNQIEEEIGDKTSEEKEALDLMRRFYVINALVGDQWDKLLEKYKNDDLTDISSVMAKLSAENALNLGKLQKLALAGKVDRIHESFKDVSSRLEEQIKRIDRELGNVGLDFWKSQDIGHCFEEFQEYEVWTALDSENRHSMSYGFTEKDKSGLDALILEDDREQLKRYRSLVDEATSYTSRDEFCFVNIEDIKDALKDPEIGLFIFDIQIGDDKFAGIKAAGQALEVLFEQVKKGERKGKPAKIIVWSASPDAVRMAESYLENKINEMGMEELIDKNIFSRLSKSPPISLNIRPKRWSPTTDSK